MSNRVGGQFGNYRLVSLLGQGGYAEVYLGQHVRLNQQAAIKVLHAHLTEQEAEHFQQEAQIIATLVHPGIVRVFDYDVQQCVPFLVIDFAPGGTLRQRYPKGSLVPLPVIVSSVKQVADALQYAHEQKFIHRDVKPENMLLGRRQEVLLSDFGIATIAHSTSSLSASAEGTSGTLAYMAPEQIEGHPRPASDQYALAVVVYEWLCGERPFEGSVSELIAQHLSVSPLPLRERMPTIPSEVEQVVLRALAKDPKARFTSVQDFAAALEQASQYALAPTGRLASEHPAPTPAAAGYDAVAVAPVQPALSTEMTPSADLPMGAFEPTVYPDAAGPHGQASPHRGATSETPYRSQFIAPTAAVVSPPLEPTMPVQRKPRRLSRKSAALLIGLVVVIVVGGILGSLSLLAHSGVIGAHGGSQALPPARGGSWTIGSSDPPDSLIPFSQGNSDSNAELDQALYLPLFYSDGFGVIHPGAASVVPTVQNGGINANATTWTFHLRPHLAWSDGQPYDARDVDFTWKLGITPQFDPGSYLFARSIFSTADVSADHLSITFHLKQPFVPFLEYWVDGAETPLPAHHFSTMAPGQILKSQDNLNPQVTNGPFVMAESVPGNRFTLVRNPRYYLARAGLPYLDKVVFRILSQDTINQDLELGTIDSTDFESLDLTRLQDYRRLPGYTLVNPPTSAGFDMLFFNFHNQVLASHREVREAIAMAIDQQALIKAIPSELQPTPQCTDHSSFYHPGFDPSAPCPFFNPTAANQLLDDNGWVKGKDGVRTKDGQRLEFEYSAPIDPTKTYRLAIQPIVQQELRAIGIKLDIQNYPHDLFFFSFLPGGEASPPAGAIAGRYDIAELEWAQGQDPDDSGLLGCLPPIEGASNLAFYCNPTLDALYQQELATPDAGERQNIFVQIHLIYLTQYPMIVLFGENDIYMVRKGTHNFQPSPLMIADENIAQWWCDGGKC
jgi:ABC-type transport system substrate-binding protein/serine/threonine protein kinase